MNDDKQYKVYVYTNKINHKKYVGQTCRPLKVRAGKNGYGYRKSNRFWNAINKYGWENFEPMILYDNLSKEEADILEVQTIAELNTSNDKYGYNITLGGYSNINTNIRIPVIQFDLNFNYMKKYDSLAQAEYETGICSTHISQACKHIYRQSGGFIWLFEKDYISNNYDKESLLDSLNTEFVHPNSRPVIQCDLELNYIAKYKNISEASRETGIRRSGISDNCIHRLKTSGGFIWMYENEYYDSINNKDEIIFKANNTSKVKHAVMQFDKDMNHVSTYPSILKASKDTKIDRKSIAYACSGKYSQAGGYIWQYLSDYYNGIHNNRFKFC